MEKASKDIIKKEENKFRDLKEKTECWKTHWADSVI